jgi:hypothetical protein
MTMNRIESQTNNPKPAGPPAGPPSGIDTILASEEAIVPSSGFLAAVMQRVEEEAAAPAPIPFPWKRAILGLILACVVFGWAGVELVRRAISAIANRANEAAPITEPHASAGFAFPLDQTAWIALALAISLASWLLARKLAGRPEAL